MLYQEVITLLHAALVRSIATLADMQSVFANLLLFGSETPGFLLPHSSGQYNVTLTTGSLVDYSRDDPYAATPTPRALMLSVFQPAECASNMPVAYMPNQTAEYQGPYLQKAFNISADLTPVFLEARLPVCPEQPRACSPLEDAPVLLFSPGYAVPRLYYSVYASAIASEGFTVITIDHPEDANIITYPDGHAVYNNASTSDTEDHLVKDVYVRAADASFVIDQLSNATAMAELLPQRGQRPFPADRVAILGHSIGGASSIIAASQDPRIRGVINLDGDIWGTLSSSGISQPVLLMAAPPVEHQSWSNAWPQLTGPKMWVSVANATHQTYTDGPFLLEAAGLDTAAFADLLGTIAPSEMMSIVTAWTSTWMNGVFTGKEVELPVDKFKEVTVVKQGNINELDKE